MAIIRSGFLGGFRKKLGPAIGRRHMGQNLILPLPHPSNKPATPKQLEAQFKLGLLNSFLSCIDKLINIGFKKYVKHNSPVNAAFAYNYDHAFIKQGEEYLINYPKIVYSRGHIVAPESPQIFLAEGKLNFSWLPQNQSDYCQYTDLASFLAYNPTKERAIILQNQVSRYSKAFAMEIPEAFNGDRLHCYMNFRSADGKLTGDSFYVGEIIVDIH